MSIYYRLSHRKFQFRYLVSDQFSIDFFGTSLHCDFFSKQLPSIFELQKCGLGFLLLFQSGVTIITIITTTTMTISINTSSVAMWCLSINPGRGRMRRESLAVKLKRKSLRWRFKRDYYRPARVSLKQDSKIRTTVGYIIFAVSAG